MQDLPQHFWDTPLRNSTPTPIPGLTRDRAGSLVAENDPEEPLDGQADTESLTLTAQVGASFQDARPPWGLPVGSYLALLAGLPLAA